MFRQVKGEGLNIGSVLTWGPGFDHQRQFFSPAPDHAQRAADADEIRHRGQRLRLRGARPCRACSNLKEQIYPGADGSKGWPTWTLPVLRWTKAQGGIGGYAHSGSGLEIDPAAATAAAARAVRHEQGWQARSRRGGAGIDAGTVRARSTPIATACLTVTRAGGEPRPRGRSAAEPGDPGAEQRRRAGDLRHAPPTAWPTSSARWTRIAFASGTLVSPDELRPPVKASGETDFPCMSGTRVGQGRSYVLLGKPARVDYAQWVEGIARGRSYVSDGYAHALEFSVDGKPSGDELQLAWPGEGDRASQRRVFAGHAARSRLRRRRFPSAACATSATRSSSGRRQAGSDVTSAGSGSSKWSSTAASPRSREVPADGREHHC